MEFARTHSAHEGPAALCAALPNLHSGTASLTGGGAVSRDLCTFHVSIENYYGLEYICALLWSVACTVKPYRRGCVQRRGLAYTPLWLINTRAQPSWLH